MENARVMSKNIKKNPVQNARTCITSRMHNIKANERERERGWGNVIMHQSIHFDSHWTAQINQNIVKRTPLPVPFER